MFTAVIMTINSSDRQLVLPQCSWWLYLVCYRSEKMCSFQSFVSFPRARQSSAGDEEHK